MRQVRTTDLEYPITRKTLNSIVEKVVNNTKAASNTTFSFGGLVGGSRAWFKFILNNPNHTNLYRDLKGYKVVAFDPTECYDSSNLAFFYRLSEQVGIKGNNYTYENASLQKVVNTMSDYFRTTNKKTLIFAIKLDNFERINPQLGNLLYSFWKDNKKNLSFVITLNKNWSKSEISKKFGAFSEAVLQNIEQIDSVGKEDLEQSIRHWAHELDLKLSDEEVKCVVENSKGLPYLSKVLCQEIAKTKEIKNLGAFCSDAARRFISSVSKSHLVLRKNGGLIYFDNFDISRNFSYQEFSVLKLLIEKAGNIVNRDEIADALWGPKAFEKYSEWAIDKFVSLVRKKLNEIAFTGEIKAKKGEGFVLLQPK